MKFSKALEEVLEGKRLTRESWTDGKFIFLVPGSTFTVNRAPLLGIYPEGTVIKYSPHIDVSDDGKVSVWNPSMEHILAEDWQIVE